MIEVGIGFVKDAVDKKKWQGQSQLERAEPFVLVVVFT